MEHSALLRRIRNLWLFTLVVPGVLAGSVPAGADVLPDLLVFGTVSGAPPSAARFAASPSPTLARLRTDPRVSMLRIGRADPRSVDRARAFSLELDPNTGARIDFPVLRRSTDADGLSSLHGHGEARSSEAALVLDGSDVSGSVYDADGALWRITPLGGGRTALYRYDRSRLRPHPPGWGGPAQLPRGARTIPPLSASPEPGVGFAAVLAPGAAPVVDVLVLYTVAARAAVGNADAFIRAAFDTALRHYGNSELALRVRLVHAEEVGYVENGNLLADLIALALRNDGRLDGVHGLRDAHGADLVHLFVSGFNDRVDNVIACGVSTFAHTRALSELAFGVTAVECESPRSSTFTHELGHNFGADHDAPNVVGRLPFPYGRGYCDSGAGMATVMAYLGHNNDCTRSVAAFSSPLLRHEGVVLGDAASADNRRVLSETAALVAGHREETAPLVVSSHLLPFVPAASNIAQKGFVRVLSHAAESAEVRISAVDDTGVAAGPITLVLEPGAAVHLTATDLESGNPDKGLSEGFGDGTGSWRVLVESTLSVEALAYIAAPGGPLAPMNTVAAETIEGSHVYYVPSFNPASNQTRVSRLRIVNPGDAVAAVEIDALDDAGAESLSAPVRLSVLPGHAVTFDASELESGAHPLSGQLGDGLGKWRLSVSADRALLVMSLMHYPGGSMVNLSRGQPGYPPANAEDLDPPPPPAPDLVVPRFSVDPSDASPGAPILLVAAVSNIGSAPAEPTRLRFYRSDDVGFTPEDHLLGVHTIDALDPQGEAAAVLSVFAPAAAGEYWYGACADGVEGEVTTGNNCSSPPVRVIVTLTAVGPDLRFDAFDVDPDEVAPGEALAFSVTLSNAGPTAADSLVVTLHRSDDARIDPSDSVLAERDISSIARTASTHVTFDVTAPAGAATVYYGACVTPAPARASQRCSASARVVVRVPEPVAPELNFDTFDIAPDEVGAGETLAVSLTLSNAGSVAAHSLVVTLHRSDDPRIAPSDPVISERQIPSLAGSARTQVTFAIAAPAQAATLYYGACVTSAPASVGQRCSASARVVVRVPDPVGPDLQFDAFEVAPGEVAPGEPLAVSLTLSNAGSTAADSLVVTLHRSEDARIDPSDAVIAEGGVSSLAHAASTHITFDVAAPARAATVYYGACVTPAPARASQRCSPSARVVVRVPDPVAPDLQFDAFDVTPDAVAAGESLAVSLTLSNAGSAAADSIVVTLHRSDDAQIAPSDPVISERQLPSLARSARTDVTFAIAAPAQAATLYYGACVTSAPASVAQRCSAAARVVVRIPAPVAPDLHFGAFEVAPGEVAPGEPLAVSLTLSNAGSVAADSLVVTLHRSDDARLDPSDPVIAERRLASLAGAASTRVTFTVAAPAQAATLYYGACVTPAPAQASQRCSVAARVVVRIPPPVEPVSCTVTVRGPEGGDAVSLPVNFSSAKALVPGPLEAPARVNARFAVPGSMDLYRIDHKREVLDVLGESDLDTEAFLIDEACAFAGEVIQDVGPADPTYFGADNRNFAAGGPMSAGVYYLGVFERNRSIGDYRLSALSGPAFIPLAGASLRPRPAFDGVGSGVRD